MARRSRTPTGPHDGGTESDARLADARLIEPPTTRPWSRPGTARKRVWHWQLNAASSRSSGPSAARRNDSPVQAAARLRQLAAEQIRLEAEVHWYDRGMSRSSGYSVSEEGLAYRLVGEHARA